MTYDWYKIVNQADFDELGVPSQEYEIILEDIGLVTVMITKGIGYGLVYDSVFLGLQMNDNNPFEFDEHACAIDENDDIYLGILVPEEE